jgi:hypothetical protein
MTHNERVLDLLSDGLPHSHHEGYRLNVMLHSRVADLRKQGHDIACWREGDSYFYRLSLHEPVERPESESSSAGSWSEAGLTADDPSASLLLTAGSGATSRDTLEPAVSEQLTLDEAEAA